MRGCLAAGGPAFSLIAFEAVGFLSFRVSCEHFFPARVPGPLQTLLADLRRDLQ